MFGKILCGILAVLAVIGWGFAVFGGWELKNNQLTYWVMLSLAMVYFLIATR